MNQEMPLNTYILIKASLIFKELTMLMSANIVLSSLVAIVSFFEPIHVMLLLIIFAVFVDFLSGLFKAWKLKEKIVSHRIRDTIIKVTLYLLLVMLVFGIQIVCLWSLPISNFVATFIMFAEAVSISENIDIISDGKLGLSKFIKKIRNSWLKQKTEKNENA